MYLPNMRWYFLIFFSVSFFYVAAAKRRYCLLLEGTSLTSWLKPCSRKDPNFAACAKKSADYAIPFLINGDRKLGLPSFNPFKISQVELFGQDTFSLRLNDLKVYGLDTVQPLDFVVDFDNNNVSLKTFFPKVEIMCDYEIDGRVLFLPLKGSGPAVLSLIDGTYNYNFTFDTEKRNGVEYVRIMNERSTFEYDVKQVMFHLDNLFNGDKRLGAETNRLLNENWQELNKELKGSIIETLISVYNELAKKIYQKVPYNELVLP